MLTAKNKIFFLIFLTSLALLSIFYSLSSGDITLNAQAWLNALSGHSTVFQQQIIFDIRLPRTLSAFVTGGLLALAGTLMQVLLRNPLADPYVLGISGGAAVVNLSLIALGFGSYWLTGGGFIGSLLSILIVFVLAQGRSAQSENRLLLTGIVVATGWGALISLILTISPDRNLRGMLFWLMGDLSYAQLPYVEACVLLIGLLFSYSFARDLNLLTRGELAAKALGINSRSVHLKLYFLSALLTACAVNIAGCIGFVGLIIPHLLRLVIGADHRFLLPATVLLGGALLTSADTLSRTLFAPQQIPVGILMAFLGVPTFLFLLQRTKT